MRKIFLLIVAALGAHTSIAQFSSYDPQENSSVSSSGNFTLSSDNNVLQIGGRVSAFYEYRTLKDYSTNYKHNNFAFKDVDLDFLGKTSSKFVYEIQLSLLDIVSAAATSNTTSSNTLQTGSNVSPNPYNPGFKAAYLAYEGKKLPFHVKLGYDKLPYSQGSLNDVYGTPFWSHANLFGGDLFSRRDLGLTLYQSFWKKKVNAYAGVYTGMGENIFEYPGEGSGTPEYIGRVDVSYPSKYKYDLIDEEGSPIPVFRVGINARYMDKKQPVGHSIYTDAPDAPGVYNLRTLDGARLAYGGDFIIKYKGISATFEAHMLDLRPTDATNPLYNGTTELFNKGHVQAAGFETGINYNWQKLKSVFSVNYEKYNSNDLVAGFEEWLYFGYAYKVSGFNSVLKFQYYLPQTEDVTANPLKYTSQFRIGYQQVF